MKITSLRIRGFRCFDDDGETVDIDDFVCFVGPNASGKTTVMMALVRLFGEHPPQREIVPDDFHVGTGEKLADKSERKLSIECRVDFPELSALGKLLGDSVPETFNQMVVDGPGKPPFCRIHLAATWTATGSLTGDVEQTLSWILTDSEDAKVIDEIHRRKLQPADRRHIRVVYVPAARDPDKQIAITTGTTFGRLLKKLAWNGKEKDVKDQLGQLQTQLASLKGIGTLNTKVQKAWSTVYGGKVATVHKSKGLEFHTVVFLGLEDSQLWNFAKQSEEEKRGFFVALSRAITRVIFTYSDVRDEKFGRRRQTRTKIRDLYTLLRTAGVETRDLRH